MARPKAGLLSTAVFASERWLARGQPQASYIGYAARAAARARRLAEIDRRLHEISVESRRIDELLVALARSRRWRYSNGRMRHPTKTCARPRRRRGERARVQAARSRLDEAERLLRAANEALQPLPTPSPPTRPTCACPPMPRL
jgi:hypothetical protein